MRRIEADYSDEIAEDIMQWMKTHTMRDLKDIAREIEQRGEDATDVWNFIKQLTDVAEEMRIPDAESDGKGSGEPVHA